MPPKKDIPLIKEPVDWVRIIREVFVGIIMVLTAWNTFVTVPRVEKKVDQVKVQTDGVVTSAKKAIAISAENLAASTKSPKDIKAAEEAWEEYEARLQIQKQVEQTNP